MKIAFLGDSITQCANVTAAQSWPQIVGLFNGYAIADIINAGIAGNTTADMLARIQTDVINQAPDVCVIGFYDETQTTAGTHVSALTLVQGVGGVANLNKSVTSGELTVPAASSVTTFAHGLSSVPTKVKVNLKCTTAELGYSVGDLVPIEFTHANTPSWIPFNVYSDATNVGVSQTSGAGAINIQHKTTFTFTAITLASWKLVINASIN